MVDVIKPRPCFRGMGILNSDRDDAELMRPGETQRIRPGLASDVTAQPISKRLGHLLAGRLQRPLKKH